MANIELEFEEITIPSERTGLPTAAVRATCPECGECTESFGTGPRSRMRCLMMLKEGCSESNYYIDPEADDRPRDPTPKPWWEK